MGKYYAKYKDYCLSWDDRKDVYCLYRGKDFVTAGSRAKCLERVE